MEHKSSGCGFVYDVRNFSAAGHGAGDLICRDADAPVLGIRHRISLPARRLVLLTRKEGDEAVLEFIAATDEGGNIQDQVALLGEQTEEAVLEQEVSLPFLRHLAASVSHQQYHGADIVTVRVETPKPASGSRSSRLEPDFRGRFDRNPPDCAGV